MISYETTNIRGKIYALLIITRNQEVSRNTVVYKNKKNVHSNNLWRFKSKRGIYIDLAKEFLAKYGITHNDLFNNVFVINHKTNKEDTFFIIDFEKATFDTKKLKPEIKSNLNKINNIKNINFGNSSIIKKKGIFNLSSPFNNTFKPLFGNSPSPSSKKQKSNTSLFGNSP